jgi:hypothetical protein
MSVNPPPAGTIKRLCSVAFLSLVALTAVPAAANAQTPDGTPPLVSGVAADPGASSARVSWATDEPADGRVEYGLTAGYGQSSSDAGLATGHAIDLIGLACETTYHYRVSSADAAGNRTTSPDHTFTTDACGSGGSAGDEFSGAALDTGVWQVHDPLGDSSVSVGSGRLNVSVPAGVSHDLWQDALHSPRVLRGVGNGDFEIEAKYDSPATQTAQGQGLVAQGDHDDLVRFDVYHWSGKTKVFAATFVNGQVTTRVTKTISGTAPVFLRMRRTGNSWTLLYSFTGTSWATATSFDFPLALSRFGVFALTAGSLPAFTSQVDYFRILHQGAQADTTPPVVGGVAADPGASSASVSWTTDEPADGRVEYGPTVGYGQSRSDTSLVADHDIELIGLACETTYHYRVSSADAAGNRTTSPDDTFTTGACGSEPGGGAAADEFGGSALDTSVWSVYDPLGDSSVSVGSGRLNVSVPAGVAHDLWQDALHSPRVLRAAGNGDFEIEAKYDSVASQTSQGQGLVAQADHDDLVRFDVYHWGGKTKVFAGTFVNGRVTTRVNKTISGGSPLYLRMRRSGATWTLLYSFTGTSWATAASFDFPLALTQFGVFALNAGSLPAFTSQVDYFRILHQEAQTDTTAPVLSEVAADPDASSASVSWTTDEPATGRVEFGPTTGYGASISDSSLVTGHSIELTGLACETTYHYRVSSADAAGNPTTSPDHTFTTGACSGTSAPEISVWHGAPQSFGVFGYPQRWLNIVGTATDPDGLSSVRYRLDGGPLHDLVFDPAQNYRINHFGDFNVQLDRTSIAPGNHILTLIATDGLGNVARRFVDVQVAPNQTWPLPFETDWATGLQRNAQVVDGLWSVNGDSVRTVEPGYDRIFALGAESWSGIDVTVPVTIHSVVPGAPHSGVGVATGWRGHEDNLHNPAIGWPLGAFCFYYKAGAPRHKLHFVYYERPSHTVPQTGDWIQLGTPYIFRMKAEPLTAQTSRYSCKVWRASDPEPPNWTLSDVTERRDGSVILVANYMDVSFGRVRVTE